MARTKLAASIDAERMVSVRPSSNMRREALSYVAQHRLYSLNTKKEYRISLELLRGLGASHKGPTVTA